MVCIHQIVSLFNHCRSSDDLGLAIDMWSLGCILSELLTGMPLFPGEDETDQLSCIIEVVGMPSQKVLDASKRARNFISSKGHPRYCTVTTLPDGTTVLQGGKIDRAVCFEWKSMNEWIVFRSFETWQTSWTTG